MDKSVPTESLLSALSTMLDREVPHRTATARVSTIARVICI